jgi:hypothetical protein
MSGLDHSDTASDLAVRSFFTAIKSKNEVMRCLKRYIACEVFHALQPPPRTAKIAARSRFRVGTRRPGH